MSNLPTAGHTQSELRDAFCAMIETDTPRVAVGENEQTREWVIGQLWNCTDTLPRVYCEDLGLTPGASYAQAARHMTQSA